MVLRTATYSLWTLGSSQQQSGDPVNLNAKRVFWRIKVDVVWMLDWRLVCRQRTRRTAPTSSPYWCCCCCPSAVSCRLNSPCPVLPVCRTELRSALLLRGTARCCGDLEGELAGTVRYQHLYPTNNHCRPLMKCNYVITEWSLGALWLLVTL